MIQIFQQCCVSCLFLVSLLFSILKLSFTVFQRVRIKRLGWKYVLNRKHVLESAAESFKCDFWQVKERNICMTKEVRENSVPLLIMWVNWAFTSLWNCSSSVHLLYSHFYLATLCLFSLLWQLVRLDCSCVLCLSLSVIPHWVFLWTPPSLLHCFQLSFYYCLHFGVSKGLLCVWDVYLGGPVRLTFRFMMWCTCFEASASPLAAVVSGWEEKVDTVWSK